MIAAVSITPDGQVAPGWGRARRIVTATVRDGVIADWQELDVAWDVLHDEGTEGAHHARVVRFLRENHVDTVITGRLGAGMARTIEAMNIRLLQGQVGDVRSVVLEVAAGPASDPV
jgi:predicted Fe-Mo cluster-binding NifX family protein